MVAEVRPSAKTCRELDRPGLLVGADQSGKGGREPDQPGVVAGGNGGGPFDDGSGDRVVAGRVPAAPDAFLRSCVAGQNGGLGP
jgi:hypothetical protein